MISGTIFKKVFPSTKVATGVVLCKGHLRLFSNRKRERRKQLCEVMHELVCEWKEGKMKTGKTWEEEYKG